MCYSTVLALDFRLDFFLFGIGMKEAHLWTADMDKSLLLVQLFIPQVFSSGRILKELWYVFGCFTSVGAKNPAAFGLFSCNLHFTILFGCSLFQNFQHILV